MVLQTLPESARHKLDLLFDGIRYSESLGLAARQAFPNYYPYRFAPGEPDPTGTGKAVIPYLLRLADGTLVRIKGQGDSPWVVGGEPGRWRLGHDRAGAPPLAVDFEPLPAWMTRTTADGFPMAQAGVSLHGDMAVVNVAPGCQYFLVKEGGESMRCTFCAYGAPDARSQALGQAMDRVHLPETTYRRLAETLAAALAETEIRHVYLVGGSMTDPAQEGERFIELARRVRQVTEGRVPVSCGSGALPEASLDTLHGEGLVDNICFNLEVWSEELFNRVCPGKARFVGYHAWIEALEQAVARWGRGRVYSAMVAGVELEPEFGLDWQQAADLAIRGAEDLCARGIIPVYSLYWPLGGRDHPDYLTRLRSYFERLNLATHAIRRRHGLTIWEGFMCHRCAYMQLECDLDRSENPL